MTEGLRMGRGESGEERDPSGKKREVISKINKLGLLKS